MYYAYVFAYMYTYITKRQTDIVTSTVIRRFFARCRSVSSLDSQTRQGRHARQRGHLGQIGEIATTQMKLLFV